MFGRNEIRGKEKVDEQYLQVHEIFYTIQGEGPFAGMPACFIRLTGCNLRCWFCDTEWDDENDPKMLPEDIAKKALATVPITCKFVVITGGEPLRQNLDFLFRALTHLGFQVIQVETAGTIWQDCLLSSNVHIVVSPKTANVNKRFYEALNVTWKYVIREGHINELGLPNEATQRKKDELEVVDETAPANLIGGPPAPPPQGMPVILNPCDEYNEANNRANTIAVGRECLKHGHRAGVQIHKLMELA